MSNIAITGSQGFIGKHLFNYIEQKNHHTYGIDRRHRFKTCSREFYYGDLSKKEELPFLIKCFKNSKIDTVFHLAAESSVSDSFIDPLKFYHNNVTGTAQLLEACVASGVKKVIFSSSAAAFRCANPYGVTKKMGENLLDYYNKKHGIKTLSLRYHNVYGDNMDNGSVLNNFLKSKKNGEPLQVHGDGSQKRDFVFVDDIVRANYYAYEKLTNNGHHPPGYIELGSGAATSVLDIAKTISNNYVFTEDNPGQSEAVSNNIVAHNYLGWIPSGNVKEWLLNHN
jgi:UDP-glucose 4-epimerase|tara:strand:+ start:289 stop:1134 length:846 start_codon:yes stop_codon:yes gene_type:complete